MMNRPLSPVAVLLLSYLSAIGADSYVGALELEDHVLASTDPTDLFAKEVCECVADAAHSLERAGLVKSIERDGEYYFAVVS